MKIEGEGEMITAQQAMEILKIKRTKLYELIKEGKLPLAETSPVRQRQKWVFNKADIEKLLADSARPQ